MPPESPRDRGDPSAGGSHSRGRLGSWRPDLLMGAVLLAAVATYALRGVQGNLTRDVSLYAYAGQQFADGVPPYLGVLNRAGPLAHAIPGVGAALARPVGLDDLLGIRMLFMGLAALCVATAYVAARDLFGSRAVGLVAASMFLCLPGFIMHAAYGPRDKTAMVLFLFLSLWAMSKRRWFSAGLLLGVATLTLQIALFAGAPALVVAVLLGPGRWRERLLALAKVAAGGLATLLVTVAYFLAVESLDEFVQGFAIINATYTIPDPMSRNWAGNWAKLLKGFQAPLFLVLGGLVATPLLAGAAFRARDRRVDPHFATLAALTAGAIGGAVWMVHDFDSWPDLYSLLPFAVLGAAGAVQVLIRRLDRRAVLAVVAVWVVATTAFAVNHAADRDYRLDRQRASVTAMLRPLPDDATIISIEAPQPLVLSGKTNPFRHQMFNAGLRGYLDDTWPGGFDGFTERLLAEEAELVAIKIPWRASWTDVIKEEYVRVGCAPGWNWHARRDLGPETLAPLRRVGERFCRPGSKDPG